MKAMIFAAGLGTRLKPYTDSIPKALAPVGGTTLLAHNIHYLKRYGIVNIVINIHHFPDMITQYLASNDNFGININISDEQDRLLETGGGLLKALPFFETESSVLVMNVDVITNLKIDTLIASHDVDRCMATLAVMERPSSRQLLFDDDLQLAGWRNNQTGEEKISVRQSQYVARAFSGIQIVNPTIFKGTPFSGKFSMIDLYLYTAKHHAIIGCDHTGDVFLDVGKPESLAKASDLLNK